jgi:hypothetical protein
VTQADYDAWLAGPAQAFRTEPATVKVAAAD